jgi:hypothetical protein
MFFINEKIQSKTNRRLTGLFFCFCRNALNWREEQQKQQQQQEKKEEG